MRGLMTSAAAELDSAACPRSRFPQPVT